MPFDLFGNVFSLVCVRGLAQVIFRELQLIPYQLLIPLNVQKPCTRTIDVLCCSADDALLHLEFSEEDLSRL
jgi:hypothetical protein